MLRNKQIMASAAGPSRSAAGWRPFGRCLQAEKQLDMQLLVCFRI